MPLLYHLFNKSAENKTEDNGSEGEESLSDPGESDTIDESPTDGPYDHLEDHTSVGEGKEFTRTQKKKVLEENRKRNNGELRDDETGEVGMPHQQSKKGVPHADNEVHIDHYYPRSKGGTNSYKNARVRLRKYNIKKGNKLPE